MKMNPKTRASHAPWRTKLRPYLCVATPRLLHRRLPNPREPTDAAGRTAIARAVASKRGNSTEGFGLPCRFVIDSEPPIGLLNLILQLSARSLVTNRMGKR